MRASDLLGVEVRDGTAALLGHVIDLRATLDGPLSGPLRAPRITALVVSRRKVGPYLGYQQPDQRGPWLIRAVVRRLHRRIRVIDWSDIDWSDIDWSDVDWADVDREVEARLSLRLNPAG